MLAAAYREPWEASRQQQAQLLYATAIWYPAMHRAIGAKDDVPGLLKELDANEGLLKKRQLPAPVTSIGRVLLGLYYHRLQRWDDLRELLADRRVVEAAASDLVWPGFRGIYWNLAGLRATEDASFASALDAHTRALALREAAGVGPDQAESLNNLGYLLLRLGDYDAAKQRLTRATGAYAYMRSVSKQPVAEQELYALLNLAKAEEGLRDFDSSLARLTEIAALTAKLKPSAELETLKLYCQNNLAVALYSAGKFAQARKTLLQCRAGAVSTLGASHAHVAEIDINLGWVELAAGDLRGAGHNFSTALALLRAHHGKHFRIAEVLSYLARTKAAEHPDKAKLLLEEALDLVEHRVKATLATALSERDRLAFIQQQRTHPESLAWPGVLDTYIELAPKLGASVEEQYSRVLKWKGALSQQNLGSSDLNASAEVRNLEAQRASIRRRLLALVQRQSTDEQSAEETLLLEQKCVELERKIRQLHLTSAANSNEVMVGAVNRALPADAVLVDVLVYRRYRDRQEGEAVRDDCHYVAYLVFPQGRISRLEFGGAEQIDHEVQRHVERILRRQAVDASPLENLFGAELRTALSSARLVIISPDGLLHRLPWCTLKGAKYRYWLDEKAFALTPSAQALVSRLKERSQVTGGNWLSVGGIDYGFGERFPALKSTSKEARAVDELLGRRFGKASRGVAAPTTLLEGRQATKSAVLELLPQCRVIHMATHGDFFQRETNGFEVQSSTGELDSALALAGANDDPTEGINSLLTAEEIGALDLSGLEMVVLSACYTGMGHIRAGQGLVGLTGALERARARSVVAALWDVDDRATAELMRQFYERLVSDHKSLAVAASLREAQLAIRDDPSGAWQDPCFWAAWNVTGDPGWRRTEEAAKPATELLRP